mgnify:CR=1 FL=1
MKKNKREVSFQCHMCGGRGIVSVKDIDQSNSHELRSIRCPHCAGHISVQFPSGANISFTVEGSNSNEVQHVLSETYASIASQHKNNGFKYGDAMKTDVAVITALPMELDAFMRQGEHWESVENEKGSIRTYFKHTNSAGVTIVAACASGMGQLNAALLTRDVIDEWNPKKLILVGIAAGLGKEVKLGDIVVSDQIVDYELGKITPTGTAPRWSVYRSDPRLKEKLANYKNTDWTKHIASKRPVGNQSVIPAVHTGVVLSGNKVIADEKTAGALGSIWTRATAIEMEASGIASALYLKEQSPSFIMIKGICDHADSKKDDKWQLYAAEAAGAFAMAFILNRLQTKDTKLPKPEKELETNVKSLPKVDFRAIRLALSSAFDLRELKILVSDLGVDWDNIAGEIKDEKIIELLWYMKRRGKLEELILIVNEERDGLLEAYSP